MSRTMLQLLGGGMYLLNKIFLDAMEHVRSKNEEDNKNNAKFWLLNQMAWAVYLLGLVPFVIIFFKERNWLFGAIELGGMPAMLCGLIAAIRKRDAPTWLAYLALLAIPAGLGYSLYDFGGITTLNQGLEIGGSAGFLIGTFLLSRGRQSGYLWFLLMNGATAYLMYIENYLLLVLGQILSIVFTVDAFRTRTEKVGPGAVGSLNPR